MSLPAEDCTAAPESGSAHVCANTVHIESLTADDKVVADSSGAQETVHDTEYTPELLFSGEPMPTSYTNAPNNPRALAPWEFPVDYQKVRPVTCGGGCASGGCVSGGCARGGCVSGGCARGSCATNCRRCCRKHGVRCARRMEACETRCDSCLNRCCPGCSCANFVKVVCSVIAIALVCAGIGAIAWFTCRAA